MMAHNILFNFIHSHFEHLKNFPYSQTLELDTNTRGARYYRFTLENKSIIELSDDCQRTYQLTDHHISIYETERNNNAYLSQYHYTAYFTDQNRSTYQLHVYFNQKDLKTLQPVFLKKDEDGLFTLRVDVDEKLQAELAELAVSNTKPIISELRAQLTQHIQLTETTYKALEKRASELSITLEEDESDYLASLQALIETLDSLIPLVTHDHYKKSKQFIKQMKSTLEQSRQISIEKPIEKSEVDKPNVEEEQDELSYSKIFKPLPKSDASLLNQEIQKLLTDFVELDKSHEKIYVKELAKIISKTYEISLLTESQHCPLLKTLHKLHKDTQQAGELLFPQLLLANKFELAQELSTFNYLLTVKYLQLALQLRNHQLVDFILTHGQFDINHQRVEVKGKSYPSAIHACFSIDSKEAPMVECLSVLMRHGGSVLANDERGLPLAHTVLSTPNHPLLSAFTANQTLNSKHFYMRLVTAISSYLAQNKLEEDIRLLMQQHIENYRHATPSSTLSSALFSPGSKALQVSSTSLQDNYKADIPEQIYTDSDIIKLKRQLKIERQQYLALLPKNQRAQEIKNVTNFLDKLNQFLEPHRNSLHDFASVKEKTIKYLQESIEITRLQSELIGLQHTIRTKPQTTHKKSKALKANETRQQEIVARIKEFTQKYDFLFNDNQVAKKALTKQLHSMEDKNIPTFFNGIKLTKLDNGKILVEFKP